MKTILTILCALMCFAAHSQSVYVLAKDAKARELLVYELKKNRIDITNDMGSATYVVEAVMEEVKHNIYKGYIVLVKNKNNKVLYKTETDKQKPLASNGDNPQRSIVKYIIEKKDFYAITDYLKEKAPLQVR